MPNIRNAKSVCSPVLRQDEDSLRFQASSSSVTLGDIFDVQIEAHETIGDTQKQWTWGARLDNVRGRKLNFKLTKQGNLKRGYYSGTHSAMWSYNLFGNTWRTFDNVTVNSLREAVAVNNGVFTQDTVYVCQYALYPYTKMVSKINEWTQSQYVSELADSTSFVFATTTARTDSIDGRSIPSLNCYGFKITEGSGDKNQMVLTTPSQPAETIALHGFEQAIDWLLSDDAIAQSLRQNFEIYVYPTQTPPSWYAGYSTSSAEDPTEEFNRTWGKGVLEERQVHVQSFSNNLSSPIDVTIDFHNHSRLSDPPGGTGHSYFFGTDNTRGNDYLTALQNEIPNATAVLSTGSDNTPSLRQFFEDDFNTLLSITSETVIRNDFNRPKWGSDSIGFLKAVETRYQAGDFTFSP